jgi:hypothetical protein
MTSSSFNCWHLLRGPDFSNEATSPAQPLANPNDCHDNLIALLATAQKHQVDLLSITSQPARGPLGIGASATVNQSTANLSMDLSLAFKNFVPENASGSRNRLYRSMIQEILILRQPAIYKARNIIDLWGISWDVHLQTNSIRPVFVYRKGGLGTIAEFFRKGPGQDYSVHEKLKLCEGIAVGLSFLHHKGTSTKAVSGAIR